MLSSPYILSNDLKLRFKLAQRESERGREKKRRAYMFEHINNQRARSRAWIFSRHRRCERCLVLTAHTDEYDRFDADRPVCILRSYRANIRGAKLRPGCNYITVSSIDEVLVKHLHSISVGAPFKLPYEKEISTMRIIIRGGSRSIVVVILRKEACQGPRVPVQPTIHIPPIYIVELIVDWRYYPKSSRMLLSMYFISSEFLPLSRII